MKILRAIISASAPEFKEALWIKPVSGGITLNVLEGGEWVPLKMVDSSGNAVSPSDIISSVVGTSDDESTVNTIYGLRAAIDALDERVTTLDERVTTLEG